MIEAWLGSQKTWITVFHGENVCVTWVKQCHKPPIWEWFIPPVYGEIGGWFIIVLPTLYMMCTMFILQIAYSKIANESSLPTGLQRLSIPKCPKYPSKSHRHCG